MFGASLARMPRYAVCYAHVGKGHLTELMIWCYFNNRAEDHASFAVRALRFEMFCIVGSTIPT